MVEVKKQENSQTYYKDETVVGNPMADAFKKAQVQSEADVPKEKKPPILVEINVILEIDTAAATRGEHAPYAGRIIRNCLEQHKRFVSIVDIDAFEPGKEKE